MSKLVMSYIKMVTKIWGTYLHLLLLQLVIFVLNAVPGVHILHQLVVGHGFGVGVIQVVKDLFDEVFVLIVLVDDLLHLHGRGYKVAYEFLLIREAFQEFWVNQALGDLEEYFVVETETHHFSVVGALLDRHLAKAAELALLVENGRQIEKDFDHGKDNLYLIVLVIFDA